MSLLCIILCLVSISTASYVDVNKSKDQIESAAKRNCHKVKKKAAVDTSMCALKPNSTERLYGVNWNYTDPELSEMSKVKGEELFSMKILWAREVNTHERPKCVYPSGNSINSSFAVIPGVKCNKQFCRYTASVQRQMICGFRGFFVYFKIFPNDAECPLADLLADCSKVFTGPVSVGHKPEFAYSDPRDPCVGDFFGLAVQIFDVDQPDKKNAPGEPIPLEITAVPVGTDLEIICTIKGQSHDDPQLDMTYNGDSIKSFAEAYFFVEVLGDTAKKWKQVKISPFNEQWFGIYVCSGKKPNGEVKKSVLRVGTKKEVEDAIRDEHEPCSPAVSLHCLNGGTCYNVHTLQAITCKWDRTS